MQSGMKWVVKGALILVVLIGVAFGVSILITDVSL